MVLPRKQWIRNGKRSAPEDAELMSWILACDHRLGDTCQLLPPRGPLPGGLDVAQSSPCSFLGSCYPDRRSMGSSANVPRTVLFAHFHCVDCEKGSWAAARWQRDPTLCTTRVWHPHHNLPGRQATPCWNWDLLPIPVSCCIVPTRATPTFNSNKIRNCLSLL